MHGLPKRQHRAMSRYVLLVVACGIASAAPVTQDLTSTTSNTTITVYGHGSTLREHTKVANTLDSAQGTAWGTFVDGAVTPSNFGSLSLQSSPNASDVDQMYAIGFAEGYLTQHRIYQEVLNLREPVLVHYGKLPSTDPKDFPPLTQFLNDNDQYVREMVASNINDPFWRALGLVLAQFDGLMAGYAQAAPATEALSLFDFQMLNGVGDLFDLIPAVIPKLRRDFASMPAPELKQYTFEAGRCSGLIKVLGDYSDLFFSHASWWSYYAMIRMMKHYHTPLRDPAVAAHKVSFSSYPGFLESLDDFYIMDSGLAMVQTTNSVFNTSLYDQITHKSVLAWQRVRVSSLLAKTGSEWHAHMATQNSGTYENQYMVLNLNLFTPGEPLPPGTLHVGEQIPGMYESADVTDQLARGYWPSYNVPYFPKIYQASGYPAVVAKGGADYSYQLAPRAKIFRRDQASVTDMESFKRIMRYNDYTKDPYSEGSAHNAICSRGDLPAVGSKPGVLSAGGCLDCKVSSYRQALKLESEVVNGPTSTFSSYGPGQKPFSWTETGGFGNTSHVGMPDTFDFVFETITPQWTP
eukprot:TRINITY_DN1392_c0_g1_i1.p1 TRINITY_DN1392_c0_g1~~TRINITY_DN1392_c0_g1_i1.p1  ORF type:complete len:578 (-),score=100.78 TRINITY_DN1392_c0_g1_i1:111-1844(-)